MCKNYRLSPKREGAYKLLIGVFEGFTLHHFLIENRLLRCQVKL